MSCLKNNAKTETNNNKKGPFWPPYTAFLTSYFHVVSFIFIFRIKVKMRWRCDDFGAIMTEWTNEMFYFRFCFELKCKTSLMLLLCTILMLMLKLMIIRVLRWLSRKAGFIILNGQKKLPPTQIFFGPRSMYFS